MNKDEQELTDLCRKLKLSVRFDHHCGEISIYDNIGNFECSEQAVLFLKTNFEEDLEEMEDDSEV
jgi:hypothetical protein